MLPLRCAFVDRLERRADCAVPRKRIQPFKAPECFATAVCWAITYFWGPFNSSGCQCHSQVVARASAKPPLMGSRPGAHASPAPGGLGPCPGPAARGLSMGAMAWKLPWGRPGRRPPCRRTHATSLSPGGCGLSHHHRGVTPIQGLAGWGSSAELSQRPGEAQSFGTGSAGLGFCQQPC